ncbi:MAG: helix-turn-helix transcriptional regulator [Candidatus Spyradosoma sp.]
MENDTLKFETYITRKEICAAFGISERQIARWLKEGCPCVRIGAGGRGDPRFRVSAVEAWLTARTEAAKR